MSAALIECHLFYHIVQRASCYAQSNYHCCLTLWPLNHQSYRGPLSYLCALRCHANVTAYDVLLNKMCAHSDDGSTFHSKNARVYEVLFIARRHVKNRSRPSLELSLPSNSRRHHSSKSDTFPKYALRNTAQSF